MAEFFGYDHSQWQVPLCVFHLLQVNENGNFYMQKVNGV